MALADASGDSVKLCNFDGIVKYGEDLISFNSHCLKPGPGRASQETAMFAFVSTAYTIVMGLEPWEAELGKDVDEINRTTIQGRLVSFH